MNSIAIVVVFLFSFSALAGLTPLRYSGMNYEQAKAFSFSLNNQGQWNSEENGHNIFNRSQSAERKKRPIAVLNPQLVNEVSGSQLREIFEFVRDTRFMKQGNGQLDRRLTWLYPDDGCYARAAVASFNLPGYPLPTKAFIFGDLQVQSENSITGIVEWWYHVAVAYRVGDTVFVIDPALNPYQPLSLNDWGLHMVEDIRMARFSLCNQATYDPAADCTGVKGVTKDVAYKEQTSFLPLEWNRVQDLGRIPELELGDQPPWVTKPAH